MIDAAKKTAHDSILGISPKGKNMITSIEAREKLIGRIGLAFKKDAPPHYGEITSHHCPECHDLRDNFYARDWWSIPDRFIAENSARLPLLTNRSFHYYFPAYLLSSYSGEAKYHEIRELLLDSLRPLESPDLLGQFEKRRAEFSIEEKALIKEFLEGILADPNFEEDHAGAGMALAYWN